MQNYTSKTIPGPRPQLGRGLASLLGGREPRQPQPLSTAEPAKPRPIKSYPKIPDEYWDQVELCERASDATALVWHKLTPEEVQHLLTLADADILFELANYAKRLTPQDAARFSR
jgi:hypothetical protein